MQPLPWGDEGLESEVDEGLLGAILEVFLQLGQLAVETKLGLGGVKESPAIDCIRLLSI